MSLAEKLAEKHLTAWQDDDGGIHILDHMLAAINEAILLTKNEWIERCAQECDVSVRESLQFADKFEQNNWNTLADKALLLVAESKKTAARIRALKEQP